MIKPQIQTSAMQYFLYGFNAAVVFILAGFMSITQKKINSSMAARQFLDSVAAVPLSAYGFGWIIPFVGGLIGGSLLGHFTSETEALEAEAK